MAFWEIVCANLWSIGLQIIFMVCTMRVLLGRIPNRGRKHRVKSVMLAFFLCALLSSLGAVCYLNGIWKLKFDVGQILWEYFVVACWTFFAGFVYGIPVTVGWITVLLGELLGSYGSLLANLFAYGKSYHLDIPQERREYLFWFLVISPACMFFCLFLVRKLGKSYRQWVERENRKKSILFLISIYPVLSRLIIWMAAFCARWESENLLASLSLILMFHLVLVYVGRDEQQKERIAQQQVSLMQQNAYIEKMEKIQSEVRRFRHDFKNMMAGMYLHAEEGDLEALQDFIQEMTEDFDRQAGSQIQLMNQLANVHVTELKGLLLEKLAQMQKEGILCELEVFRPLEGTRMRTVDLCRCLGILLDNAVEEVCGKKDGCIHVMISSQKGCTTFRVKNTLYGTVDLHRLGIEGYSAKGSGRGIGLSSYRRILDKYDFVLSATTVRDGYFIQEFKIQET